MDDIQKITNQLEYLFLKKIASELMAEQISVEKAKEDAKAFKQIEPFTSVEDAQNKIGAFVQGKEEFTKLKEYVDAYHEEKHIDEKIEAMRAHLRENRLDEAIAVAKN